MDNDELLDDEGVQRQLNILEDMQHLFNEDEGDNYGFFAYFDEEQAFNHAYYGGINSWVIPVNPSEYDIEGALRKLRIIEWRQDDNLKSVAVDDIAYIYIGSPIQAICWKCLVVESNVNESVIDDSQFWRTAKNTNPPFIHLKALIKYSAEERATRVSYKELTSPPLQTVNHSSKVNEKLLYYLLNVDRTVDTYDGN